MLIRWAVAGIFVGLASSHAAVAADLEEVANLYRTGRYEECAKRTAEEIAGGALGERWDALRIQSELARGEYRAALAALEIGMRRYPSSVMLFLIGRDARRFGGRGDGEIAAMAAVERRVLQAPHRYATPEGQVALGRFLLLRGADPKQVLDRFYDAVIARDPDFVEAFLASAELALDKQDYGLAVETLRKAPPKAAESPRFHYLKALALSEDDRPQSDRSLAQALEINPRHLDSLLLKVDGLIDAEKYVDAADVLGRVIEVNPSEPRAWAYRAVLAHLLGDREKEAEARRSALAPWAGNPEVDSLIGRKLAQKYRFAEGAAFQRDALALDSDYLPAKIQLSQALLRLGEESEGWKLVDEIFAKDGYNVVAYNLIELRDRLSKFRTLQGDGLLVKMDPREADLYGPRVLALLKRAKATLGEKYGVALPSPVIVEIFPRKKEFAVRTFGLPGADGLLGVCFGRVITANSPASQGEHPSNWEAVLWHELCHTVTLTKTRNKMPRWLSEGISVYEEGQQDPSWRGALSPRFREMIRGDELTALSRLSGAFLAPKSAVHLQFAYYESALAVEFLVQTAGLPVLKGILEDLGDGVTINDSLASRTHRSLDELDLAFAEFARAKATGAAPGATWDALDLPGDANSEALTRWLEAHPENFWGSQRLAARLVAEEKWPQAKAALLKFKALDPSYVGADNAYEGLAAVHKRLSEPAEERAVLEDLASRDGDASPAYLRLMELSEAAGDWEAVARNADRLLAVNPLIPVPHRQRARASEQMGRRDEAISAYRALSLLDETDPAEIHFRLAKLLHQAGKADESRREVLKSLEEAPRFLDAHRLLLELIGPDGAK